MTRNSCKLILVLLVCAVPLVTFLVNAQQDGRPSARLYALADADRAAGKNLELNGQRQAQAYLDSSDSEDQGVRGDTKREEAGSKSASARRGVAGLGAEDGPSSTFHPPAVGERGWIVVLASLGLALSLAAAGLLAWFRARPASVPATMFLPQTLPHSSATSPSAVPAAKGQGPSRRAA
jgi:hypothetical protein